LVVGTVVSVRQAVRATRAERVASAERDTATAAGRAEALARADAQRRQEQAEALLAFMLGDFRTELKKLGRLELLDAVGEKALAYFAALEPGDLTDTALARQAKALTQIGETRLDQARYNEATAAFMTAYGRAAALAARHPRVGDMLFERAQAEYWIGFVARRRGDAAAEREWLTRYRDSALALAGLEGKSLRAQRELMFGHHNLAVLELDGGNLAAARAGFLAEGVSVREMLATHPADTALRFQLADAASWLGRLEETAGRYAAALEHYADVLARLEELVAQEPAVMRWRFRLADAVNLRANVLAIAGRRAEAASETVRAIPLLEALVAHDPKNRQWEITLHQARLLQVALAGAEGRPTALPGDLRSRLEALVAAEPASRIFKHWLAAVWLAEARLLGPDRAAEAQAAVTRAIELGEALLQGERVTHLTAGELARAHLLAGELATARQDPAGARQHWQRARAVLEPRLAGTNDWRLLDPAAQVFFRLGETTAARALAERLRGFGYRPLDPLAVSTLEAVLP
jgi:serine/threonine-protein kinase